MRNLALLNLFVVFASLAFAERAFAECGVVDVVKGDVQIKGSSQGALQVGAKVCPGDTITTGKDARAKLKMPGDAPGKENFLNINPESQLQVEAYENKPEAGKKKVLLNVMYGKMRATVNSKYSGQASDGQPQLFQVKTKSAVAGVRGTDFLTSFDRGTNKMGVVTFHGKVEVGQPGAGGALTNSVSVGAGQQTDAVKGQSPSAPRAVPPGELQAMNSSTQVEGSASGSKSTDAGKEGGEDKEDKKDEKKEDKKDGEANDDKNEDKKDEKKDEKKEDKKDDGKKEETKKEDGKKEDSKKDEPKKEDGKKDEPKKDEPKKGDPKKADGSGDGKKGDSAGGDGSGGTASGGTAAAGGSEGGDRGPASVTSGDSSGSAGPTSGSASPTMETKPVADVGGPAPAPSSGTTAMLPPPPPPPMVGSGPTFILPEIPVAPVVVVPPTNNVIDTIIQSGPAKVNVRICLPGEAC